MGKRLGYEAIKDFSRKDAMELFHFKERGKRVEMTSENFKDGRKHAVMLISSSSTGRTSYLEANFPGFKMVNVNKYTMYDDDHDYQRLVEIFQSCFNAGRNIAIEGNFFDMGVRSFILNALHDMGYVCHIVLFGNRAMRKRIGRVCLAKAKELVNSQFYLSLHENQIEYMRVISNLAKLFARDALLEFDNMNYKFQYDHDMYTLGCESFEIVKTTVL